MRVPFVDLYALHRPQEAEFKALFQRVLEKSSFILGPEVKQFEENFAFYLGVEHCVALNSGTAALHLAFAALGIKAGDEVITVANTFIATAEAVDAVGAKPVFVDCDPVSYNMDVKLVEARINERTKALVPVHLYGQPADLEPLMTIARRHNLALVEDACQAHGAHYKGSKAGTLGDASCFSFYPGKNLGCFGEGGALVTNDAELALRVRKLRDHGSAKKYYHDMPGYNFRLEGLQGGILNLKLPHLDAGNERRRALAARYNQLLAGSGVVTPVEMPYAKHVYHLYVIQCDDREGLQKHLAEKGIDTGLHYPVPLHLQVAYESLGYKKGDFPVSERLAGRILSLPMYPDMGFEAVEYVAAAVKEFVECAETASARVR